MCTVSMVVDQWFPQQPTQPWPNQVPWPVVQKDPELARQMLEVLERLEALDKRFGLLEQCKVAEPEKRRIKAKLRRIAKKPKP